ncbi:uncharacterized protein Gasu_20400 [Galdieria sulphuraria]|uniref:Nuclear speckle splicing regulatory protein 1 N-terminal domain-containing protein n=1 Tax=Galdieria sulphuraria TaxID=130081 RepID=M2Y3M6_GALSU|nr:uncharacterized protein Gasu_20400 [Galdieria sulphuraria]EME30578.1 hypothetical protein Gasu_20400 [Galdieria sulphuraria]|eukprot:XP_005707098.1 hypothetical protein Gasu_20400 [Galdieria sulphuraria]
MSTLSFKLPRKRSSSQTTLINNKAFRVEDREDEFEEETQELRLKWSSKQGQLAQTTQESSDDPNAFAYDEVYEQLQNNETFSLDNLQKNRERKSRYLAALKTRAEERKMEQELLEERLSFKEREKEEKEGEFKDKEKFITFAYKEKMRRLKEWEQQQQQRQASDGTQGGTVQANMSRFYCNLLTNNVALGLTDREPQEDRIRLSQEKIVEQTEVEGSGQPPREDEESEKIEQQRKKALFGEPEKRPGGLFIPSVKN